MRKHWKQLTIIIAQILIFYLFPLISKPLGAIGTVLFIVMATFVLALLMGSSSTGKIKFLYPVLVAVLFIPSVFIYYNETALVQAVWYLVISFIGLSIGALVQHFYKKY